MTLVIVAGLLGGAPALADDDAFREAQKEWKDALKSNDVHRVVAAAEVLGSTGDKKAVSLLLEAATRIDQERIFEATVSALAELARGESDEAAEEVRKKARRASDPRQRIACVEALSQVDAASSAEVLGELLDDRVQSVRVAAIDALGRMERKEGVGPLIALLEKREKKGGQEIESARRALEKITGARFSTAADWRNFWDPRKETFDPRTGKVAERGETVERGPTFFGSEVLSKRVLLVLDISNSMRVIESGAPIGGEGTQGGGAPGGGAPAGPGRDPGVSWPPDPGSRFIRARNEMIRFVKTLKKDVAFGVIAFGEQVVAFNNGQLMKATPKAKALVVKWVEGIQWGAATRTDLALEKAFEAKGADTVYLLSDGNPEKPGNEPISQDGILEQVRKANRFRRLTLHTMGFPGPHRAFLEKLAQENRGTYKDIR